MSYFYPRLKVEEQQCSLETNPRRTDHLSFEKSPGLLERSSPSRQKTQHESCDGRSAPSLKLMQPVLSAPYALKRNGTEGRKGSS